MVKKKTKKKVVDVKSCGISDGFSCNIFCIKIAVIAFTLFILTVWPIVRVRLLNIHWGWYLGIMIVFGAIAMKRSCFCSKK